MQLKFNLTSVVLCLSLQIGAQVFSSSGELFLLDKNGLSSDLLAPHEFVETEASNLRSVNAGEVDLGNGMFLLSNTDDPNSSLAVITVSDTQWNKLRVNATYYAELKVLTNSVYTKFKDDYDFIFFVLDTIQSTNLLNSLGFYGVNCGVSNAVKGTGKSIYNSCSTWGSAGKLKSVMYFPYGAAILNGPTLHELSHNWGAYMCPTFNRDNTAYNGHWGISNAGGQLGGFRYVRTVEANSGGEIGKTLYQASFKSSATKVDGSFQYGGFGVNANGGNGVPYSDIELYMMGMKSAQELNDAGFHLDIYSGNSYEADTWSTGYFWSTTLTSYTIDDLIASKGVRVPDAASSQKSFKILTVAITKASITTHQYSSIINAVNWLAGPLTDNTYSYLYNFRQATYDRGSLTATGIINSAKTALFECKSNDLKIAPSIVKEAFVVSGFNGKGNLTLYDLNGRVLFNREVVAEESIAIGNLPGGLYIVKVNTTEGVLQTKLIKE